MKLLLSLLLCIPLVGFGQSKTQLVELNPEWKNYELPYSFDENISSDVDLISFHFDNVLALLKSKSAAHLNSEQQQNRAQHLQHLTDYRKRAQYPKNFYKSIRAPYFIDDEGTACAVAYLLQTSNDSTLACSIATSENGDYIKEIENPGLANWQQKSGFSMDELALIQPTYGPPPLQRPVCGVRYRPKNLHGYGYINNNVPVYYKGQCRSGRLHGKWLLWNSDSIYLQKGYFVNGKKEGKWMDRGDEAHPLSSRNYENPYGGGMIYNWPGTTYTPGEITQKEHKPKRKVEMPIKFEYGHEYEAHYSYINGLKQGKYRSYDKNGNLARKGQFEGDYRHGTWYTYQSGKLIAQHTYDRGDLHGKVLQWDDKGRLAYEANYYYGQQNGSVKQYQNGILVNCNRYKNNQLHGLTVRFDKNGNKKEEEVFENGQSKIITKWTPGVNHKTAEITAGRDTTGKFWVTTETRWFSETPIVQFKGQYWGNIYQYKRQYSNSKDRYGTHTVYWLKKDSEGNYYHIPASVWNYNKVGQLHGPGQAYRENGSIYSDVTYKNGTPIDGYSEHEKSPYILREKYSTDKNGITTVIYYDNKSGLKTRTGQYKDHIHTKIGTWKFFDKTEQLTHEHDYENGNQIAERIYYPNGQLKTSYGRSQRHPIGPFEAYYENGQLKTKGSYTETSSVKIGTWQHINEKGQLIKEDTYIKGKRPNIDDKTNTVLYHTNGQKKEAFTTNYKQLVVDTLHAWNESGQLLAKEIYNARGLPIGTWEYFFSNGKLCMTLDYNNWTRGVSAQEYFPSGEIKHQYYFTKTSNSIALSNCTSFDPDGKVKKELHYKKNKLFKSTDYETNEYYTVSHAGGRDLSYLWATGGIRYQYRLDNNYCPIYGTERDQLGRVTARGSYYKGVKTGPWYYYNRSVQTKAEQYTLIDSLALISSVNVYTPKKRTLLEEYTVNSNGIPFGTYTRYHKNGKKAISGYYSSYGEKDGTWYYYNKREKVIKQRVFPITEAATN